MIAILLLYLVEREIYLISETWNLYFTINRSPRDPQSLSLMLIACSWCEDRRENVVLLRTKNDLQNDPQNDPTKRPSKRPSKRPTKRPLKTTPQNDPQNDPQIDPQIDSSGSTFQDHSGESLNPTFNLIFAVSSESLRFDPFLPNPKPQVYFNSFNKPSTLPLSNYLLLLSESIIEKT
jgi:hypothetical protein